MAKKLIVARRGASVAAAENTIEAFGKAIALGADIIEVDLRRINDGTLVIYHDPTRARRRLSKLSYPQLLKLSQGSVPTFRQTFEFLAGKIKLDVELKEAGYEQEVLDEPFDFFRPQDFVISSFKESVISRVKALNRRLKVRLILGRKRRRSLGVRGFTKRTAFGVSDFLAVHYTRVAEFSGAGKPLYAWTVDQESQMRKFFKNPDVTAIITNKPDLAIKLQNQL